MATFDGTNAFKGLTLTSGNAVATSNGAAIEACRSSDGKSTGKWCFRLTATTVHTDFPYRWMLAFQAGGYDPNTANNIPGYETNQSAAMGVQSDGQISWLAGQNGNGFASGSLANGDVVDIAVDVDAKLFWRRKNAEGWNPGAGGTPDPATGTLGIDLTNILGGTGGLPAAPWYFGFASAGDSGDVATITTFTSPPSGYTDWNAVVAANVPYNPWPLQMPLLAQ